MAAIGEIRKRSWLLVVVIVVGMLAFILGDTLSRGGGSIEQSTVATVNGQEITSSDYQVMVDAEFEKTDRAYKALYGQPAPASLKQQLSDNYMSQYLNQEMFQAEYNKLGLEVTQDEFNDLIQGKNIDPQLYEQYGLFVGPDRKFNEDSLNKILPLALQQEGFQYFLENIIGDQAEKTRLQKKYFNMITKGLYVTSYEAKKDFQGNSNTANFSYVYAPFDGVSEEEVSVSESDLKAYYNKHKNEKKYEQEDKVSFQFVEFAIEPSEEDLDIAREYLVSRKDLFKDAENDSTFIIQNSDTKNLDFATGNFPSEIDSTVNTAEIGDVIGPYRDGEYFKISKVIDNSSKEQAEVRHILIGNDVHPDPVAQQKLADSITSVLRRDKSKFEALVTQFSTDQGSVRNGGKYEWFDKGRMVPEFEEVSFNKPVNSINQAKTTYGIHIVEVLGKRDKKELKVASVDSEIRRSKETINQVRDKALEFITSFPKTNVNDSAYRAAATKMGLSVIPASEIAITQKEMPEFEGNFMQVKKWAFGSYTKEGDVSDDFVFDKKIAVAHLISRSESGTLSFDKLDNNTKANIRYEVLNEKKAEFLKNKMKGSSLEEIAKASGTEVKNAASTTMSSPNIEGIGNEPAVVGTAFGVAANTVSSPIVGNTGVFVIKVAAVNEAPLPENFDQQKEAAKNQLRTNAQNRAYQALREAADVEDNRDKVNVLGN